MNISQTGLTQLTDEQVSAIREAAVAVRSAGKLIGLRVRENILLLEYFSVCLCVVVILLLYCYIMPCNNGVVSDNTHIGI